MIVTLVTSLFAVVFIRSLIEYLRSRDPIQREVTLVFSSIAVIFVLTISSALQVNLPVLVRNIAVVLMLSQPLLTLRLVGKIRRMPPWVLPTAFAAYALSSLPVLLHPPGPLSPRIVAAAIATFFVVEMMAAVFLTLEALRRAGSPRARLICAALGSASMALALVAISLRLDNETIEHVVDSAGRVLALLAALAYAAAFAPPQWLRRLWSATATYAVSQHLLQAPPTESPQRTWQRYAETVSTTAGADGAVVLLRSRQGNFVEIASARVEPPTAELDTRGIEALLVARQPVDSTRRGHTVPQLAAVFAARAKGGRFVTAVPLHIPPAGSGALILLHRHRTLFSDDDARLLAALGAQAGILAERGGVLAEQERLTAELAESIEALQRASKAKSDFLANMSHELRTPLNSIIGFSELMRAEEQQEDLRMVPDEWIEHIHSSGRRLLALINDILDLTKVEAGRLELRLEPLELREAVSDVLAALRPVADKKHLRLVANVPELTVQADRMRLRQILDNLLSNALKFTPDSGTITVSANDVGHIAMISVADTGAGIAAADRERVFAEFQQVGDIAAQKAGTGLGLALTRRLVQAHGGKIELASEVGVGSTFTIHLPLAVDDLVDSELEPVQDDGPDPVGGGILVVEDEAGAARLLRTYLEDAGHRVSLATTGQAGLLAARRAAPQAILLDVLLPDIDGWEVLRQLKDDAQTRDIPVIIVTVVDERERGMALGAADYLVKPIDRDELLDRISRHMLIPPSVAPTSRILVIDDDPGTLQIVQTNLRRQGYEVTGAASGVEGLRVARTHQFDLIICDLLMPDMDGYAVIAALASDGHPTCPPIVVFTALDLAEADRARLAGQVMAIVRKSDAAQVGLRDWLSWIANQSQDPVVVNQA